MRTFVLALAAALLSPVLPGRPTPFAGRQGRPTTGAATIRVGFARAGGGYTTETLPVETYVARVLAGEAARDSPPAALDALAITIRTFALVNRSRHRADGFDVCDQTHCQVLRAATTVTEASAARTSGRVLLSGGSPASIYYTASCGGRTEVPSAVWPGAEDPPYLPSRADAACGGGPVWQTEIDGGDLLRVLAAAGFRGDRLRDLRIVARDRSGRVARLRLDGLQPDEISGQDLRVAVGRTLGWQRIRSAAFEVRRESHRYRISGHGSGHGVGLCVIGSVHLAAEGESAESILGRYFPGLNVGIRWGSDGGRIGVRSGSDRGRTPGLVPGLEAPVIAEGIVLSLPDEDDGGSLGSMAARARDELARVLAVAPPARVTIRVHPTTDSFEQATGRRWFASGAVVDGEVHLPPLSGLRARGVLERAVRRELVHVMVDSELARLPAWVRDGAAIYFADPHESGPPSGRVVCPSDADLERPVSIGALANAYASARACFARQIAQGKNWKDVK